MWILTWLQLTSCWAMPSWRKATPRRRFHTCNGWTIRLGWGLLRSRPGNFPRQSQICRQRWPSVRTIRILLYYLGRASGLLSKQSIDTLLAAYPDSARAHQALAENYFVLRQMPEAEKEFREALRERPDIPELHLELGEVYAGAFQWSKAEAEFRTQAKLQPGNAEAAYRLGTALLEQGKAKEARVELARADKLLPDMPETLYSLGKAASLEGDTASCRERMDQAALDREGQFTGCASAFCIGRSLPETGQDGGRAT